MSALHQPELRPAEKAGASRLRLVPRRDSRVGRVPFLALVASLLAVGMVGLLLLNTTLQNQAFEANRLKRRAVELSYLEGELHQRVVETSSTRELTRQATALGLRPNWGVQYVDLTTGRIGGVPNVADGRYFPATLSLSPEETRVQQQSEALNASERRRQDEERAAEDARQRVLAQRARDEAAARRAATDAKAKAEADAKAKADAGARGQANQPSAPTSRPTTNGTR